MSEHVCPDCGRKFKSGAALGGHRRVHTKGRLTKVKGGNAKPYKRKPPNTFTYEPSQAPPVNPGVFPTRTSPQPVSGQQVFFGASVTDLSSSDANDTESDSSENMHASNEFSAMPPPIKRRKLNDAMANGENGPTSIGYVVKPPSSLKKPTKMDAIREQIGLAMTLYHFNVSALANHCSVHKQVFGKWLNGEVPQKREVGVNANANSNAKNNFGLIQHGNKAQKSSKKTKILKIKIPKKTKHKSSAEKAYYLTPILADQIAEKMKKWMDNFIKNGFCDEEYFKFVHHYKRYKKGKGGKATKHDVHSFDNLGMKWDKIKVEDTKMSKARNNNPVFDWNDDSSFYYRVNEKENANNKDHLIPIQIEEIVNGKEYKDSFLWDPSNGIGLKDFVQSLCNDLKQSKNLKLRDRIVKSAKKQIEFDLRIKREYERALDTVGSKMDKRSHNYLQHLRKKSISINDNMGNLMNNISDDLHGHILIKLKITHGKIRLIDEFLWNLNDEGNDQNASIEKFANVLCAEQGLPFILAPSIAVSMRRQISEHKVRMTKSLTQQQGNKLNEVNDPLLHESLRYVGRKRESDLKNLKKWEPNILVYRPPNKMKTIFKEG